MDDNMTIIMMKNKTISLLLSNIITVEMRECICVVVVRPNNEKLTNLSFFVEVRCIL